MPTLHYLSTQHCLTIAAAFIAIIAVCATLINSANAKHDSLATRIRDASKEHRELNKLIRTTSHEPHERDVAIKRCKILDEQIYCFKVRFRNNQWTQRLLYFTIALFTVELVIFMIVGLFVITRNISDEDLHYVAQRPAMWIGILTCVGAVSMLIAAVLQILEVGQSYHTLDIETEDCPSVKHVPTNVVTIIQQSVLSVKRR